MTTHEHPTQAPGQYQASRDESREVLAGTQPVTEHTAPEASADPAMTAAEPAAPSNAPAPPLEYERDYDQAASNGTPAPNANPAPNATSVPHGAPTVTDPTPAQDWQQPAAEPSAPAPHSATERESATEEALFAENELADLRARWAGVQAAFVDDPQDCVQKADVLVSDLVEQLTSSFAGARSRLEEQWAQGQEASTEDLRVALMHYREFFERLLAV